MITVAEFKNRVGITTDVNDVRIVEHIAAAAARVRAICHRDFAPHTGGDTARVYRPMSPGLLVIDDCYQITKIETDDANDGTYATLWTAADYETDPANGIGPDGQTGWPVNMIRAIGRSFPVCTTRRPVKVTGKWGWAAIPAAVKEATYLLAHRLYYEVSVPGGVTPPNVDFGIPGQQLSRPYTAEGLLKPYVRADKAVGIAG